MPRIAWICLAACWCALPLHAAPGDWTPVPAEELERTRGRYATDNGLQLSLGIERVVSINGDVVAQTRFSVADLENITASQASGLRDALATQVIQNGPHNSFLPDVSQAGSGGVIIQNTLNDQVIRNQTIINANVNSGSLLKALNFASSLNDALNRAVGAR
jgi:hypothetical protein